MHLGFLTWQWRSKMIQNLPSPDFTCPKSTNRFIPRLVPLNLPRLCRHIPRWSVAVPPRRPPNPTQPPTKASTSGCEAIRSVIYGTRWLHFHVKLLNCLKVPKGFTCSCSICLSFHNVVLSDNYWSTSRGLHPWNCNEQFMFRGCASLMLPGKHGNKTMFLSQGKGQQHLSVSVSVETPLSQVQINFDPESILTSSPRFGIQFEAVLPTEGNLQPHVIAPPDWNPMIVLDCWPATVPRLVLNQSWPAPASLCA